MTRSTPVDMHQSHTGSLPSLLHRTSARSSTPDWRHDHLSMRSLIQHHFGRCLIPIRSEPTLTLHQTTSSHHQHRNIHATPTLQ